MLTAAAAARQTMTTANPLSALIPGRRMPARPSRLLKPCAGADLCRDPRTENVRRRSWRASSCPAGLTIDTHLRSPEMQHDLPTARSLLREPPSGVSHPDPALRRPRPTCPLLVVANRQSSWLVACDTVRPTARSLSRRQLPIDNSRSGERIGCQNNSNNPRRNPGVRAASGLTDTLGSASRPRSV